MTARAFASLGALVVVAALALLVVVLELWRADWTVPWAYTRDALFHLAVNKGVVEHGWPYAIPELGAPQGLELYDFPAFEPLSLALVRLLALATPSAAVATNLFFVLSFPLTALAALLALRCLGVSPWAAAVAALLYAFQPFHLLRGAEHLFLTAYYCVPLLVLIALWVGSADPPFWRAGRFSPWGRRTLATVVICVLAGLGNVYYAFFGALCIAVACGWKVWAGERRREAWAGVVAIALLGVTSVLPLVPSIAYAARYGPNLEVAYRPAAQTERYGLKIVDLLWPIKGHRFPPLAELAASRGGPSYEAAEESVFGSLGLIAAVGFVGLLLVGLYRTSRPRDSRLAQVAILNLAAVLFGTVGGGAAVLALLVTAQFRAPNRLSIVIAFFALLAVAWALDALGQRYARGPTGRALWAAALGGVLLLGILDQTAPGLVPPYEANRTAYQNDQAFVSAVEQQLPAGAAVFQLPYTPFPESGAVLPLPDYQLLRPYLHSHGLRWSYGAMKGRANDWQGSVAALAPADFLPTLAAAEFAGLAIDRAGYRDGARRLQACLEPVLSGAPLESPDRRYVFLPLDAYARDALRALPAADLASYRAHLRQPVEAVWNKGFYPQEGPPNERFRWAERDAELSLVNRSAEPRAVTLQATFSAAQPEPAPLQLTGDLFTETLQVGSQPVRFRKALVVPPGRHPLRLTSGARPADAPSDPRRLYFRVADLAVSDDQPQLALPHPTLPPNCTDPVNTLTG